MCGIVGIVITTDTERMPDEVQTQLISALTYLQHRGQDSAGIALNDDYNNIYIYKDVGLVSQVFDTKPNQDFLQNNLAWSGIGHVRYSTQGVINTNEAQPFYVNSPYGITLAHNGNLTNIDYLKNYIASKKRHINTNSDSELLLNILAIELNSAMTEIYGNVVFSEDEISTNIIFDAVNKTMNHLQGSYSVVAIINNIGLIAFRDPNGIRPLCLGSNANTPSYMIASESVAFTGSPYNFQRDILSGECIFINHNGDITTNITRLHRDAYNNLCCGKIIPSTTKHNISNNRPTLRLPCLFEYIYFARPDSIIDGISVYKARELMGYYLSKIIREHMDYRTTIQNLPKIDVIIPVPETSRTYAIKLAEELGIPYREAFVKNRYIARTFIMSNSNNTQHRTKMVKMKLNTIDSEFKDKNVLIVDDSIVRGTTSKELVKLAKDAGAKCIWFASAAPPICFANRLGIDIPTDKELIAHNRSNSEIAELLGCDRVFYNDLNTVYQGLKDLALQSGTILDGFEISCFLA